MTQPPETLVARLRSSAKAFRENTVYTSEGDAVRLGVQADEADEAAARIEALEAALEAKGEWRGMIPREPDLAMHAALTDLARLTFADDHERDQFCWFAVKAWRVMHDAVPQPTGQPQ